MLNEEWSVGSNHMGATIGWPNLSRSVCVHKVVSEPNLRRLLYSVLFCLVWYL
uniref:Uncharacterized protein n=1 Tax=Picea sitchensis TaxID=3332 RepID=A9NKQ9_PICSI|nr:unknown [Picea sitchensis]